VLRQSCLVKNEKVDHFLANCFRQEQESAKDALNRPEGKRARDNVKVARLRQFRE